MSERIEEPFAGAFGLTPEEAERLFGHEDPEARQSVDEALGLLHERLLKDRLAEVVHEPVEAYGGRSIVEALIEDPKSTLERIRASFDWSSVA